MTVDTPLLGVIVTVLFAILGLAAAWGTLAQKVRGHEREIETYRRENREDHQIINKKLDIISSYLRGKT